ncbi:MAG TPA: Rieske (2Fe-2S) protein [Acidimicrobiia bacterium]|nr:Rieske (2Fe-2S) protein [Acidimicrobiia bacterium]HZQ78841.1 Rieske (2Fe-2S) protein [Acidimicrobiia bacterium]
MTEETEPREERLGQRPAPQPELQPEPTGGKPGGRAIALAFIVSLLASIALGVVYALGGQPQLEGTLLFFSFGGIAAGFITWGGTLLPQGPYVQERHPLEQGPLQQEETTETFEEGAEDLERRRLLIRLMTGAFVALGAALVFPVRSLGSRPGGSLFLTAWRRGARAVDEHNKPVRPEDLDVGGVLTVFPEGNAGSADSQTLLIKLGSGEYRPPPGRENWAVGDIVAFSKVCTHAGCPVGLYEAETHRLYCPCHQSVFAVLDGAVPTSGPATRPLPQLPLAVDADGYLVAQGDYHEPIGPGFWNRDR